MKMRKIGKAIVIAPLLVIVSCVKAPEDSGGPVQGSPEKTSDLVVPAGFDWKTSGDVLCDVTAERPVRVTLAAAASAEPFAVFTAGKETENPVSVSLPLSVEKVYLRYETPEGFSEAVPVDVSGGRISYSLPSGAAAVSRPADIPFRAKGNVEPDPPYSSVWDGMIIYPAISEGWGTLMFEDLWPAYGDYDFNDFVANYKVQLYMNNRNMVREMVIGIRVKAVGGSLPNDLYLCMRGVKGGEIRTVEKVDGRNDPGDAAMVQLNPGNPVKEPAVFRFDGIKSGPRPEGSTYLNTERGYEVPESEWLSASFYVEFRNSVKIADVSFDSFDFFIARPYGEGSGLLREVHCGGYEATPYGERAYADLTAQSSNTDHSLRPYYSNANLVWAMNIPSDIPHAYESTDFTAAYPNFAAWAASGGALSADWYTAKAGNRVNSELVNK